MKVRVILGGIAKTLELRQEARVIDAIKKIGVSPETVIPRRGREILLENENLKNNDRIELIKIVSGG